MNQKIYDVELSKKIFIIPGIFGGIFLLEALIFFIAKGISIAIMPFIIGSLILLPAIIKYKYTKLSLYENKIAGSVGFLSTKTLDAHLEKINDISISKGLLGNIFGYGTINISTSSSVFHFKGVSNCEAFKEKSIQQIEEYKKMQAEENAKQIAKAMKMS